MEVERKLQEGPKTNEILLPKVLELLTNKKDEDQRQTKAAPC
jgi:hypothetical protein